MLCFNVVGDISRTLRRDGISHAWRPARERREGAGGRARESGEGREGERELGREGERERKREGGREGRREGKRDPPSA